MWTKWIFDRVVSLVGLIVLSPVFLVVAILIRIKMPGGPVLFKQKRFGKDGRTTSLCTKLNHYKLNDSPEL